MRWRGFLLIVRSSSDIFSLFFCSTVEWNWLFVEWNPFQQFTKAQLFSYGSCKRMPSHASRCNVKLLQLHTETIFACIFGRGSHVCSAVGSEKHEKGDHFWRNISLRVEFVLCDRSLDRNFSTALRLYDKAELYLLVSGTMVSSKISKVYAYVWAVCRCSNCHHGSAQSVCQTSERGPLYHLELCQRLFGSDKSVHFPRLAIALGMLRDQNYLHVHCSNDFVLVLFLLIALKLLKVAKGRICISCFLCWDNIVRIVAFIQVKKANFYQFTCSSYYSSAVPDLCTKRKNCSNRFKFVMAKKECGIPKIEPKLPGGANRIVGGSDAVPHSYPWQAHLSIQIGNGAGSCGGALLPGKSGTSSAFVVTAAHCVQQGSQVVSPDKITVTLGAHDIDAQEASAQKVKVKQVHMNGYDVRSLHNDIAVLELEREVAYSPQISPICLPKKDDKLPKTCYVTGWGATSKNGATSKTLKQVDVDIFSDSKCNLPKFDSTKQFCAGSEAGDRDSCNVRSYGDSGGPLVCKDKKTFTLMGIVSLGKGCGDSKHPGFYTKVTSQVKWLKSLLK
ncbi:putative trypsin [Trichinella spiralis]|uniref:putative trypsin n=1 Tax=Trichinella spiralis TaxID=6334 RepID=UPI0001EFCA07|nr:putative trypsin [Trichinella spiralis]